MYIPSSFLKASIQAPRDFSVIKSAVAGFVVAVVFQAVVVHNGDFGVLHCIELVTECLKSVTGGAVVVTLVIGRGCGKVMLGCSRKVQRCHTIVLSNGFIFLFKMLLSQLGRGFRLSHWRIFVGHKLLANSGKRRHTAPTASPADVKT